MYDHSQIDFSHLVRVDRDEDFLRELWSRQYDIALSRSVSFYLIEGALQGGELLWFGDDDDWLPRDGSCEYFDILYIH